MRSARAFFIRDLCGVVIIENPSSMCMTAVPRAAVITSADASRTMHRIWEADLATRKIENRGVT